MSLCFIFHKAELSHIFYLKCFQSHNKHKSRSEWYFSYTAFDLCDLALTQAYLHDGVSFLMCSMQHALSLTNEPVVFSSIFPTSGYTDCYDYVMVMCLSFFFLIFVGKKICGGCGNLRCLWLCLRRMDSSCLRISFEFEVTQYIFWHWRVCLVRHDCCLQTKIDLDLMMLCLCNTYPSNFSLRERITFGKLCLER